MVSILAKTSSPFVEALDKAECALIEVAVGAVLAVWYEAALCASCCCSGRAVELSGGPQRVDG